MSETGAANAALPARETRRPRGRAGGLALTNPRVLASIAALSAATLMAEVYLPAGVWAAALHVSLVFLGISLARPRDVYVLAAVASALVVAGAVLTLRAPSTVAWLDALVSGPHLANRLIVLLAVWAVAAVIGGARRREAVLRTRLLKQAARRQAEDSERAPATAAPDPAAPAALGERIRESEDPGHEIRTLLNAIVGFSDAAKQEIFGPISDPRYRDYLGHINDSGWTLLRIFEKHFAAAAFSGQQAEPGARRTQGEAGPPGGKDPAKTTGSQAVNQ